jgi:hypothetical protein
LQGISRAFINHSKLEKYYLRGSYGSSRDAEDSSMIKETDAAYLAALFDVKASFALMHNPKPQGKNRRKNREAFAAHLTITTKRLEVVDRLAAFGSRVLENSGSFRVYWNYEEMRDVLEAVIPFMRIKKQQAELLLQFLQGRGIPEHQSLMIKELNSVKYYPGLNREYAESRQNQDEKQIPATITSTKNLSGKAALGRFDILSQDMFGNPIWIECAGDIATARGRIDELYERCPKGLFVIWDHESQEIVLELAPL